MVLVNLVVSFGDLIIRHITSLQVMIVADLTEYIIDVKETIVFDKQMENEFEHYSLQGIFSALRRIRHAQKRMSNPPSIQERYCSRSHITFDFAAYPNALRAS